jgi:hypothetical protein
MTWAGLCLLAAAGQLPQQMRNLDLDGVVPAGASRVDVLVLAGLGHRCTGALLAREPRCTGSPP